MNCQILPEEILVGRMFILPSRHILLLTVTQNCPQKHLLALFVGTYCVPVKLEVPYYRVITCRHRAMMITVAAAASPLP